MKTDQQTQFDKFRDAARALECDDDEARFDERVKKLVKHKPVADMSHARAKVAKLDAQMAKLDSGAPAHDPSDGGLRASLEGQRRTWLAVLKASE